MEEMPSKEQLFLLVNSLCKLQDKILSVKGMPKHIQQPITDKVEPLKLEWGLTSGAGITL